MPLLTKHKHYLHIILLFLIVVTIIFIDYSFLFKKINQNRTSIESLRQKISFLGKKIEYFTFINYEKERIIEIESKLPQVAHTSPTPLQFLYNLETAAKNTNQNIDINIIEGDKKQFDISIVGNNYQSLINFILEIEEYNLADIKLKKIIKIIDREQEKTSYKLKSDLTIILNN